MGTASPPPANHPTIPYVPLFSLGQSSVAFARPFRPSACLSFHLSFLPFASTLPGFPRLSLPLALPVYTHALIWPPVFPPNPVRTYLPALMNPGKL